MLYKKMRPQNTIIIIKKNENEKPINTKLIRKRQISNTREKNVCNLQISLVLESLVKSNYTSHVSTYVLSL